MATETPGIEVTEFAAPRGEIPGPRASRLSPGMRALLADLVRERECAAYDQGYEDGRATGIWGLAAGAFMGGVVGVICTVLYYLK